MQAREGSRQAKHRQASNIAHRTSQEDLLDTAPVAIKDSSLQSKAKQSGCCDDGISLKEV
jgi:hypothetical protein